LRQEARHVDLTLRLKNYELIDAGSDNGMVFDNMVLFSVPVIVNHDARLGMFEQSPARQFDCENARDAKTSNDVNEVGHFIARPEQLPRSDSGSRTAGRAACRRPAVHCPAGNPRGTGSVNGLSSATSTTAFCSSCVPAWTHRSLARRSEDRSPLPHYPPNPRSSASKKAFNSVCCVKMWVEMRMRSSSSQ
jgi:hypothetical protein